MNIKLTNGQVLTARRKGILKAMYNNKNLQIELIILFTTIGFKHKFDVCR